MRRLTTLLPSEYLKEHAEELSVVECDRKLRIPVLVWSLVFGFAQARAKHSLASDAVTTRRPMRQSLPVASNIG